MKLENLNASIANIVGDCNDEIKLPNGRMGAIRFNFEWGAEFETLNIQSGFLTLSERTTATFYKTATNLRVTQIGPGEENVYPSIIIGEYIADFIARLKKAELSVTLKNL